MRLPLLFMFLVRYATTQPRSNQIIFTRFGESHPKPNQLRKMINFDVTSSNIYKNDHATNGRII